MDLVVVLGCLVIIVSCSHGQQQQRAWTQRDCQQMSRACNPLPKGARGPTGQQGNPGSKGPPGPPGRTGPPGLRGPSGSTRPGPPGAPAPRGERGGPGYPGLRGEPGEEGPQGVKGQKGYNGQPGVQGENGLHGDIGFIGKRGPPGQSVSAWTKCTWTIDTEKDKGLLKECNLIKRRVHTSLHVIYEGNLQIGLCRRCCKRWYFTFNGAECAQPSVIDAVMSGGFRNDYPHHNYGRIEGICETPFQQGLVRIGLRIENCSGTPGALEAVNIHAYNPEGRILIREISPSQK